MLETVKEMILEFQQSELFTGVPRLMEYTELPGKASVFIGVRRCGKSTFLNQIMEKLLTEGIHRNNMMYLNFFDDRLRNLQHMEPGIIHEAYYSLFPEKKNRQTVCFFLDEIQVVPGWESFVDRLMRTEKSRVFIIGSSSRMLSKDIATQMRGRALSLEVFPFSFREYLKFKGIQPKRNMPPGERLAVQNAFEGYWESGGFPEVAGLNRALRIKIHQEYFNAILFRDLVERHDISHPKAVIDLAHWLADHTGSLYSINSLTGYLKSLGHKVPKQAVSDYLNWFEDAFVLFTVRIYDSSLSRVNTNPKKIYCIDHSLVTSVSSGIMVNSGHLLENLVFTALRRNTQDIHYFKTKSGKEVDFITGRHGSPRLLIQVSETLRNPNTRKRETASLTEAMAELQISRSSIVTRNEQKTIETESGTIEAVPIWRFLLQMEHSEKDR
jgi:predicted AAA+ superfamily ATPase